MDNSVTLNLTVYMFQVSSLHFPYSKVIGHPIELTPETTFVEIRKETVANLKNETCRKTYIQVI